MEISLFSLLMVFLCSVLGAMGLGGGSLLMLYLVLFTELPQPEAQALNLFLFLPTAALALFLHRKNGLFRASALKKLLPAGITGAILGSGLGSFLDASLLQKIFGLFLLCMALRELHTLWKERKTKQEKHSPGA